MKRILMFALALSCSAVAQGPGDVFFQAPVQAGAISVSAAGPLAPIKGAPYSATITNESVQTLADGNRIVQSSDGSAARDSQGRTRQDTPLPMIGGLAAADAPHLVLIQDPVGGVSYTLNLTDKTAWKHAIPLAHAGMPSTAVATNTVVVRSSGTGTGELPPPPPPGGGAPMMFAQRFNFEEQGNATTENLGTQTMEGVQVTGVRTTRTIAAGKIGNDRPINIVTEVWTSTELKTIVLSKRSDPRSGEQTFKLTNIQRGDPDPSLFAVPSDYKMTDNGPQTIVYRTNH
jgi:hypothetical protein